MRIPRKVTTPEMPPARSLVIHPTIMVSLAAINEAAYNPRKFTPKQLADLKGNIRRYGFLDPLAIRKMNTGLIGGHLRIRAVREVCTEDKMPIPAKLPAVVLDIHERDAKMLNIALNRLGGEFDNKKLAEVLASIQAEQVIAPDERDLMGFKGPELTDLLTLNDPPAIDHDPKPFAKGPTISLMFSNDNLRDATRETLAKRAEAEKCHPGDVVYRLLGGDPNAVN